MIRIYSRTQFVKIPPVETAYRFPIIRIVNRKSKRRPSLVPFQQKKEKSDTWKAGEARGRTQGDVTPHRPCETRADPFPLAAQTGFIVIQK